MRYQVNWPKMNLLVLPASAVLKKYEAELRDMGHIKPGEPLDQCFFYISDVDQPDVVRLYVGEATAALIRNDAKESDMTYMESIQMRLMVTLMESHLHNPEMGLADECIKYARCITRHQLNGAFRHLDYYSDDPEYGMAKADLHALIHFIQKNL